MGVCSSEVLDLKATKVSAVPDLPDLGVCSS